jgi:uncharacterized protein (TIGR02266 family)
MGRLLEDQKMAEESSSPTDSVQADKRKNLRAPLLTLRVKLDDGSKAFFGYTKNISRSGMFISTINPKKPGDVYQVEIPLPAPISQTVQCACEVIWSRHFEKKALYEPGMGLKFCGLSEEMSAMIDRWVHETNS